MTSNRKHFTASLLAKFIIIIRNCLALNYRITYYFVFCNEPSKSLIRPPHFARLPYTASFKVAQLSSLVWTGGNKTSNAGHQRKEPSFLLPDNERPIIRCGISRRVISLGAATTKLFYQFVSAITEAPKTSGFSRVHFIPSSGKTWSTLARGPGLDCMRQHRTSYPGKQM
jgi:hypothetical protein